MSEASEAALWIEWVKIAATIGAPFLAASIPIFGGIFVYFKQKKYEREETLRVERQALYRDYLLAIENSGKEEGALSILGKGFDVMTAVSPYHEQLILVAPDPVVKASLAFIRANVDADLSDVKKPSLHVELTQEEMQRHNAEVKRVRDTRFELLTEMRRDILSGTKVSGSLKHVAELIDLD